MGGGAPLHTHLVVEAERLDVEGVGIGGLPAQHFTGYGGSEPANDKMNNELHHVAC